MIIIVILIVIIIILYIVFLFSLVDPRHPCVLKTNRRRWGAYPPPMSETASRDGSTDTLSTLILQSAIGILRSRKLDFGTAFNKQLADI